jgi:hypothetical protein
MINSDIELLKTQKNYKTAFSILQDVLSGRCPDIVLLERLYGSKKSRIIQSLIKEYLTKGNLKNRIVRITNEDAPMEIALARREVENDVNYQKIHSSILLNKVPDFKSLEIFYGEYSSYVRKILEMYAQMNLKRKCEISASSHLNRVGACVFQLKMNDTGKYNYSSTAIMHDSIEDLLKLSTAPNGKGIDVNKYNLFIEEYIPEDLQSAVKILTNHYNLIISFITGKLLDEDKAFTRKNILAELHTIEKQNPVELIKHIKEMIELISKIEVNENELETIKWECYKNLYLEGIAHSTILKDDHRIYEIKGVDLSDNSHGKGSLSIESRIRNINKNLMWGIKGYTMQSSWKPFNDHIEEIVQDALYSAEFIILNDLLKPDSSMDFMMSTLLKIEKLENVFFVK